MTGSPTKNTQEDSQWRIAELVKFVCEPIICYQPNV